MKKFILFIVLIFISAQFLPVEAKILKSYSTTRVLKSASDPRVSFWMNPANVMTAHGTQGVLGYFSPIGFWGPYGNMPFNATSAFKAAGDWSEFANYITQKGGPLSPQGPTLIVSEFGQQYFMNNVPNADLLAPGGALSIMGNAGVWSPLGIMGPFGPNGAHGLDTDFDGNYLDSAGNIVRNINLWGRDYPLYEFYRASAVDDQDVLDTSFVVEGIMGIGLLGGTREYLIASDSDQWIHLHAINLIPTPVVTIRVYDMNDNLIESSTDFFRVNFVALYAEKGTQFKVKIRSTMGTGYRFFVTGAQAGFEAPNPDGPHILNH